MEAARRASSLDSDKLREELLKLKINPIFSDYAVDERGYQTANKGPLHPMAGRSEGCGLA
jgi:branched-chain amino acid transport system substrate-binding protein